jgi:hypothetical protein
LIVFISSEKKDEEIKGTYIAEVEEMMECVEGEEDSLIQVVRTEHHINSNLF